MPEVKKYPLGAVPHKYTGKEVTLASIRPNVVLAAAAQIRPEVIDLESKQSPVFMQNWGSCVLATEKSDDEAMQIERKGTFRPKTVKAGYSLAKQIDGIPGQSGTFPWIGKMIRMGVGLPAEETHPDVAEGSESEYVAKELSFSAVVDGSEDIILGAVWLPTDEEKKAFLAASKGRGFAVTIPVYSNYVGLDSSGTMIRPSGEVYPTFGYHRVYCVGYDDIKKRWKLKNSWGKSWGKNGYFYVSYEHGLMDEIGSLDAVASLNLTGLPMNLAWPVDEPVVITQPFGARPEFYKPLGYPGHMGDDFRARIGAKLYAVDAGTVIWAANLGGYG